MSTIRILLAIFAASAMLAPRSMAQVNVQGQWSTASYTMPINPIHTALLYNGKILVVAGSGNCPPSQSGCPSGAPYGPSNGSGALLLDPVGGAISQFSVSWDMFCNSMVELGDGRIFINGGTTQYDPFHGAVTSAIFDPTNNTFTNVQNMAHGRWYPTVIMLANGQLMTFSGTNENSNTNTAVEIYTVGTGWSTQYLASWTPPLYPRLHLLPNGTVFYSGSGTHSAVFNPANNSWTTNVATTNYSGTRTYGSSVLLPLMPGNSYDPKIMILGGNSPATNTTEIIDMGAASPKWVFGPNMSQARIEMNAVILPNGKVLAVGGSVNDEDTSSLSLNADLYDPVANTFSSAGANATQRLYHSVALLLPDATVWLAGGNPTRGTYNKIVEIYKPAYLFTSTGGAATRPSIASAPQSIAWGNQFMVQTSDAASISSVVLVRNGSSTHAFNMDQRLLGLSFTIGSGSLTVTAPPNGNVAPPGYYMLFLLNSSGVPSIASFVHVGGQGATGTPATPTNLTPTAGNAQVALSWSASTGATSYNVKRSTTSGGPYTTITSPTTTSYTDTGLSNGTTYYYVVSAVNPTGESANSSEVNATPQATAPATPTNVTATAGDTQVALSWNLSTGATSYNVKRSTSSGGPYATIASPTTTSYTDTGVTNGTTYYYVVSAVNTAEESANSTQVSATPAAGTAATPTFSPAPGSYGGSVNVTLSDTTPGAVIHCTTDGSTPTGSSGVCTTVNVTVTATIKAIAMASGYNNSSVASGTYTITSGSGSIAFVQANSGQGGASATSVAVAYKTAQAVGDLNIVVVGWADTTASVASVTDSNGNTYSLAVGPTRSTGLSPNLTQAIYYTSNIAGTGTNTVTVTFSTAARGPDVQVFEYGGVQALDVTAAAFGTGATGSSGSATTTSANELIFGAGMPDGGFTGAGAGFTKRQITPYGSIGEDEIVSATGTYAAAAPAVNGGWVMQMATFH